MAQWEADFNTSQECQGYPVLDFDDVNYILTEEQPANLMVLCRSLEGKDTLVGYSYSYAEPWESTTAGHVAPAQGIMSPRPNRGKGERKEVQTVTKEQSSLYIAELFIAEGERGLGLGELLLAQTLNVHSSETSLSHLFVSSKNVGAVRCYLKFGYQKGLKPSGDLAHDLVMELPSLTASVALATVRFDRQLTEGIVGARKRRSPTNHSSSSRSSSSNNGKASKQCPPSLTGASKTAFAVKLHATSSRGMTVKADAPSTRASRPALQESQQGGRVRGLRARTETETNSKNNVSRVHASAVAIKPSKAVYPHTPAADPAAVCRASKRSPLMSTSDTAGHDESPSAIIQRRQQKIVRTSLDEVVRAGTRTLRSGDTKGVEGGVKKSRETRSTGKNRFMISLFSDGKRKQAEERIKALGGEVINADRYDSRCTHLIAARPATTEKFLCATAAGKYILHPSYIDESFEAGYFLDEEGFRWSSAAEGDEELDDYGRGLAKAPIIWKERAKKMSKDAAEEQPSTGCFDGVVAVLLSTNDKQAGFTRILEAGGATVFSTIVDACKGAKRGSSAEAILDRELGDEQATHVFISKEVHELTAEGWDADTFRAVRPVLEELDAQGARFMLEDYIVEKIVRNIDLRAKLAKGYVVDAAQWVEDCGPKKKQGGGAGLKRKAEEEADGSGCSRRSRASLCDQAMKLLPVMWR